MAKRKSSTRKDAVPSRIKDPVKPLWMRIIKWTMIVVLNILMVLAIVALAVKYYRLVSKH